MKTSVAVSISLLFACAFASAQSNGARTVKYAQSDIVEIHAKLRFSTLIVLPSDEDILDFTTGDKDYWIINGSHNLCYLHPAAANIQSDLNLVTTRGHIYSFLLTEISKRPSEEPDLKVFIEPKDSSSLGAVTDPPAGAGDPPQYVRASEVQAYRDEIAQLRTEMQRRDPGRHRQGRPGHRPIPRELPAKPPLRLHLQAPRRQGALPHRRHLPRRQIHLHPVLRPGKTHGLRTQGRQARPRQLHPSERRLRHPQDRGSRIHRGRQEEG